MCLQLTRPFLVIPYVRRITSNSSCLLLAGKKAYLTLLVPERVCVRKVSPCGRSCTWWDEIVAGLNPFLHHHHHHQHHHNNCLIKNVIPIKVISLGPLTARPSKAPTFEDLVKFEIRQVHTAIFAWIIVVLVSHINPFLTTCKYLRYEFWISVKPLFNFPAGRVQISRKSDAFSDCLQNTLA